MLQVLQCPKFACIREATSLLMSFDLESMDFDEMLLGGEQEVSLPWDDQPAEASQLEPGEALSTIEPVESGQCAGPVLVYC